MAKQAVARTVDLEPIDRLEEKIKLLVGMVTTLRAEQAKAADENARLIQEIDTLRARLADAGRHERRAHRAARRARRDPHARRRDAAAARGHLVFNPQSSDVRLKVDGRRCADDPSRHRRNRRTAVSDSQRARRARTSPSWRRTSIRRCATASDAAPASDMLGLAVLVALNIADEYFRARDHQSVRRRRAQRARAAAGAARRRRARASRLRQQAVNASLTRPRPAR